MQINYKNVMDIYKPYDKNLQVLDNLLDAIFFILNKSKFVVIYNNMQELTIDYVNVIKKYINKINNIHEDIIIVMNEDTAIGLVIERFELDIVENNIIIRYGKDINQQINIEDLKLSDHINMIIDIISELAGKVIEYKKYVKNVEKKLILKHNGKVS